MHWSIFNSIFDTILVRHTKQRGGKIVSFYQETNIFRIELTGSNAVHLSRMTFAKKVAVQATLNSIYWDNLGHFLDSCQDV